MHQSRRAPWAARLAVPTLIALASCGGDEGGYGDTSLAALDAAVVAPATNPISPEKASLGRLLFFDPVLSATGDVACGTCHIPELAYTDGLPLAIGVGGTGLGPDRVAGVEFPHAGRNAPSLLNVAFNGLVGTGEGFDPNASPMFWDHRTSGLEAQVLQPIASAAEMRGSAAPEHEALPQAIARLTAIEEYVELFEQAFGPGGIDEQRLAHALATYVRSLVVRDSPFDRFLRGDESALSAQQQLGFEFFQSASCNNCHSGPMLSDWSLRTLGVGPHPDLLEHDEGAGGFRFRSVSLRNVELTAPYMHNGTLQTLEEVVDYYLLAESAHPSVPHIEIAPVQATQAERLALVAFLEALTDTNFPQGVPASVPSGLPVQGVVDL